MVFKNIIFKHTNVKSDDTLREYTSAKLELLNKHISATETDITCEVEFEREAPEQHSGSVYRVEVNLLVAGNLYRAEATEASFEAAVDKVRNELDQELRRSNSKRTSLFRRGSRKIKEMMRFGKKD